ncbi:hypothetical protein CRUP_035274 [Coryphaenoides rupestris]|nr:hypothetical protein CRUP_035274 [Coryphaenoides rupestris]
METECEKIPWKRRRSRNLSGGSSRPRLTKKIHFIKNMRPYDTRGSRIVLICAKKSLCAAFSVLPYGESFHIRYTLPPNIYLIITTITIIIIITNIPGPGEFPSHSSVSYAQFLYPTNALVRERPSCSSELTLQLPASHSSSSMLGARGPAPLEIAMAFVYFEKLVLQGRLNKHNRKMVSSACLLLAAKISSDLKKQEVKHLIDKLEECFRLHRRELIQFEFTILVALQMALYLPDSKVLPHFRRLLQRQPMYGTVDKLQR